MFLGQYLACCIVFTHLLSEGFLTHAAIVYWGFERAAFPWLASNT